MEIVQCTASDAEKLAELNRQLIEDEQSDNRMTLPELVDRMRGFLDADYYAYFFLEGGETAGYALVRTSDEPLYLRQFFICREYRRRHLGREAFRLLLGTLGTDTLDIEVLSRNERGVRFWESLGFKERSRYMRFSE